MVPKKEALKGIIKAMKELKVEKMEGYTKQDDEKPAIEVEMHRLDKEKAKKLKEKLKSLIGSED